MVLPEARNTAGLCPDDVDVHKVGNVVKGIRHFPGPLFRGVRDDGGEEVGFDGEVDVGKNVAGRFVLYIKGVKTVTEFFQGLTGGHAAEMREDIFPHPVMAVWNTFFGEQLEAEKDAEGLPVEDDGASGESLTVEPGGFTVENEEVVFFHKTCILKRKDRQCQSTLSGRFITI